MSKSDFPNLFGDTSWQTVTCRFEPLNEMLPLNLISNVNLVPFRDDRWLVLRLQTGEWEVPGGTLEPGESYSDAISRELIEEAGARLITFEPLGTVFRLPQSPIVHIYHIPNSIELWVMERWKSSAAPKTLKTANRWQAWNSSLLRKPFSDFVT